MKKIISIRLYGEERGKRIVLPSTLEDLFKLGADKFKTVVQEIVNSAGNKIINIEDIASDDILYVVPQGIPCIF